MKNIIKKIKKYFTKDKYKLYLVGEPDHELDKLFINKETEMRKYKDFSNSIGKGYFPADSLKFTIFKDKKNMKLYLKNRCDMYIILEAYYPKNMYHNLSVNFLENLEDKMMGNIPSNGRDIQEIIREEQSGNINRI